MWFDYKIVICEQSLKINKYEKKQFLPFLQRGLCCLHFLTLLSHRNKRK